MKFGALNPDGTIISRNPCGEIPADPSQYAKPGDPDWERLRTEALEEPEQPRRTLKESIDSLRNSPWNIFP